MKKLAIFILIVLSILALLLSIFLYSSLSSDTNTREKDSKLQEAILKQSDWIYLTEEDFYGYLNGTYTSSVQTIISSLEEAVPVIFQISGGKFEADGVGTYVVASAFNSSNEIYVYYYNSNKNKYIKNLYSLEYLLEDAAAAYIYNGTEGLR